MSSQRVAKTTTTKIIITKNDITMCRHGGRLRAVHWRWWHRKNYEHKKRAKVYQKKALHTHTHIVCTHIDKINYKHQQQQYEEQQQLNSINTDTHSTMLHGKSSLFFNCHFDFFICRRDEDRRLRTQNTLDNVNIIHKQAFDFSSSMLISAQ